MQHQIMEGIQNQFVFLSFHDINVGLPRCTLFWSKPGVSNSFDPVGWMSGMELVHIPVQAHRPSFFPSPHILNLAHMAPTLRPTPHTALPSPHVQHGSWTSWSGCCIWHASWAGCRNGGMQCELQCEFQLAGMGALCSVNPRLAGTGVACVVHPRPCMWG